MNEVKPKKWILPNRIGYTEDIYNKFNHEHYPIIEKGKKLFSQQRVVRDFLQESSPYRGLLLYHELGSGKSGASIVASEAYVKNKNIFVLTPASLATNYENEILKLSELGEKLNNKKWVLLDIPKTEEAYKILLNKYGISTNLVKKYTQLWVPSYENDILKAKIISDDYINADNDQINTIKSNIIKNKYKFISYNGLSSKFIKTLDKDTFNNSFIIIDEIHNFISKVVNGSKFGRIIYNYIMTAKDCKLVLLSGTPIINDPFEVSTLINLIRGPMNIYSIVFDKKSNMPTLENLNNIMNKKDICEYIDEYYIDNHTKTLNISLLPKNYKRNDKNNNELINENWIIDEKTIINNIISELNKLKNIKADKYITKYFYSLPDEKKTFNETFINNSNPDNIKVKNSDLFMRRVLGTVSYYSISGTDVFPTVLPHITRYLYMTKNQLKKYQELRNIERIIEKKKSGLFSNKTSVYRAFSRMACNFVFPEEIERVYPNDIKKTLKKEIDKEDDDDILLDEEEDIVEKEEEKAKKPDKKPKKKEEKPVEDDLEYYKDKLVKKCPENKIRNPENGRCIDKNGQTAKTLKKKGILGGAIDPDELYEAKLQEAIDKVVKSGALNIENLKNHYSPKYAQIINDIEESPGSVLIYSQFRSVEGLGLLTKSLEQQGFKEIEIKKVDGSYQFTDKSIFEPKYDNKRFVIFNQDKEKTNVLKNLFNGSYDLLPSTLRDDLPSDNNQLYGKIVKAFCITASGAEGISLKNVRRVIITEPYWNNVRINQVIGRAIRAYSHIDLPKKDQNVQVFTYIMKISDKDLEELFQLRRLDKGKTTDEHILELAIKKEDIINQFLNMLKSASIDCIINSKQNKPLEHGYKCYNWAINVDRNDLSYTSNINDDYKIMNHVKYQITRKNTGKVITHNNIKYVLVKGKIYDYYSYINSGVLLPANIKK